jgi:hypothetical protein
MGYVISREHLSQVISEKRIERPRFWLGLGSIRARSPDASALANISEIL